MNDERSAEEKDKRLLLPCYSIMSSLLLSTSADCCHVMCIIPQHSSSTAVVLVLVRKMLLCLCKKIQDFDSPPWDRFCCCFRKRAQQHQTSSVVMYTAVKYFRPTSVLDTSLHLFFILDRIT